MVDHANVITQDIEDIAEEEGGSGIQPLAQQEDEDEDEEELEDGDLDEDDEDETQA